jgi:hypothetical protein
MTARWKLSDADMIERIVGDVRKHGAITMHAQSGRMYRHKHGYDVPSDVVPQCRLDYTNPSHKVALKWLRDVAPRVEHIAAWITGNSIMLAAIVHAPSLIQACTHAESVDAKLVYSCKYRESRRADRVMNGQRTQVVFKGVQRRPI